MRKIWTAALLSMLICTFAAACTAPQASGNTVSDTDKKPIGAIPSAPAEAIPEQVQSDTNTVKEDNITPVSDPLQASEPVSSSASPEAECSESNGAPAESVPVPEAEQPPVSSHVPVASEMPTAADSTEPVPAPQNTPSNSETPAYSDPTTDPNSPNFDPYNQPGYVYIPGFGYIEKGDSDGADGNLGELGNGVSFEEEVKKGEAWINGDN